MSSVRLFAKSIFKELKGIEEGERIDTFSEDSNFFEGWIVEKKGATIAVTSPDGLIDPLANKKTGSHDDGEGNKIAKCENGNQEYQMLLRLSRHIADDMWLKMPAPRRKKWEQMFEVNKTKYETELKNYESAVKAEIDFNKKSHSISSFMCFHRERQKEIKWSPETKMPEKFRIISTEWNLLGDSAEGQEEKKKYDELCRIEMTKQVGLCGHDNKPR